MISFTKVPGTDEWGIRVTGKDVEELDVGKTVEVTKKDGSTSKITVGKIDFYLDYQKEAAAVCTIVKPEKTQYSYSKGPKEAINSCEECGTKTKYRLCWSCKSASIDGGLR